MNNSAGIILKIYSAFRHIPGVKALVKLVFRPKKSPLISRELFGLHFSNPIGLASGMDTNGDFIREINDFGFGFIEIGPLTNEAQDARHYPQLVHFFKEKAILSSSDYANKGVKHAIEALGEKKSEALIAANIIPGRNAQKEDDIAKDIRISFTYLYDFVDFFVVNISSPNEEGQITVRDEFEVADIVTPLLDIRLCYGEYRPILLKISTDFSKKLIDSILDYCMMNGVDGIVVGGHTTDRSSLAKFSRRKLDLIPKGRISGAPLYEKTLETVKYINEQTKGRFPIVACGGIISPAQALKMLQSGASLIEYNTALHYNGPGLIKKTVKCLLSEFSNRQ